MRAIILTSGIGFGTYIPSVILMQQLKSVGVDVEIAILEKLFFERKQEKLLENQREYCSDFKVAKVAMRIPTMKQNSNYDEAKINRLIEEWKKKNIEYFIVFSGNWKEILKKYERTQRIHLYCVHMDCIISPSWKGFDLPYEKETWMIGKEDAEPDTKLYVDKGIVSFNNREDQLLIHGGGWGLGLENINFDLEGISGYKIYKISSHRENKTNEIYKNLWTGEWNAYSNEYRKFPPLYYENKDINEQDEHYVYKLEKESKAIISKPGGGTLCEGYMANVPIILTEPLANHEKANGRKWEKLGFGINMSRWKESNFSEEFLKDCYFKLYRSNLKTKNILWKEIYNWLS